MAILAAILSCPEDAAVDVHTDSESCIGAINRDRIYCWETGMFSSSYAIPQRRVILSAARPVMCTLRAVIAARSGPVRLHHVRAHYGSTDRHSLFNAEADRLANRARVRAARTRPPNFLFGERSVTVTVAKIRVVGSYRRAIERRDQRALVTRLRKLESFGALARQADTADVLSYCRAVQRTHDPVLARFAMCAICGALPTERTLSRTTGRGNNNMGRGAPCKMCVGGAEESQTHALLECRHSGPVEARTRTAATTASALPPSLALLGARPPAYAPAAAPTMTIPSWFHARDAAGGVETLLAPRCKPFQEAALDIARSDPLARAIGLTPPELSDILGWDLAPMARQLGGTFWVKSSLKETAARVEAHRLDLLRGAVAVWSARCRAVNRWWHGPQRAAARADMRRLTLAAGHRRMVAKRARADKRYAKKHPRPPGRASTHPQRSEAARKRVRLGFGPAEAARDAVAKAPRSDRYDLGPKRYLRWY